MITNAIVFALAVGVSAVMAYVAVAGAHLLVGLSSTPVFVGTSIFLYGLIRMAIQVVRGEV